MTMGLMASKVIAPIAWLVPALIVAQAAMVGETMFGGRSLIALHGSIGNLTFLLAAITLALAWSTKRSGFALLLTFTTVLLLFAQIGLGYLGHRTGLATASSVHVTLGVLVMGVSAAAAMRCTSERGGLPPSTSA
jgi:hypothetical protein